MVYNLTFEKYINSHKINDDGNNNNYDMKLMNNISKIQTPNVQL